jgi:hypothetical protein
MSASATAYVDPATGALSAAARPGWEPVRDVVPGVRAPLVLHCALHGRHEAVDTVTSATAIDLGHARVTAIVRAVLAAACPTCRDHHAQMRAFQLILRRLTAARAAAALHDDDRLTLPIRSYLAIGQALNAPRPLPEALAALAEMAFPCDPPALPVGAAAHLDPAGQVTIVRTGQRPPDGARRIPSESHWCLMRCADHGWEHLGALAPPDGKTLAVARELGRALLAQATRTCDDYAVSRRVMEDELDAVRPASIHAPAPPLDAFRAYRAVAAALSRATADIGYVAARALEQLGATGW